MRDARIWCNLGDGISAGAVIALFRQMGQAVPGLDVIVTTTRGVRLPQALPAGVREVPRPNDTRAATERFLANHGVRAAVFAGAGMLASAIPAAQSAGCPLVLLQGRPVSSGGLRGRLGDFREKARLRQFDRLFAATEEEAAQFRRIGVDSDRIDVTGPLQPAPPALPCNEREREALARVLAARPVWVASGLDPAEFEAVEAAHRRASRSSHRLLLIVVPAALGEGDGLARRFAARGWTTAIRSLGDEPDPDVQTYVADAEGELGLWYRLAPITLIASSLIWPGGGLDPFQPASLGSAVMFGPYMHRFAEEAGRLHGAGAAIRIDDPADLGDSVTTLLQPDRPATLAHRAWDVVSEGALASDRVIMCLRGYLEEAAP